MSNAEEARQRVTEYHRELEILRDRYFAEHNRHLDHFYNIWYYTHVMTEFYNESILEGN